MVPVAVLSFPTAFPLRMVERDGVRIRLIGNLHGVAGDPIEVLCAAVLSDGLLRDAAELRDALRALHGNFALIVEDRGGGALASVDKIKSYPLSYRIDRDDLRISGDAQALRMDQDVHNAGAFLEFAMAGYVTNGETLFEGIRQLRGGEFLVRDRVGRTHVHEYYRFYDPVSSTASPRDAIEELHAVTEGIFRRLIGRLDGRTALIPLSGGYDSRLVITTLKHLGYDAIRAFSYGIPGNCEAAAARVIAERLGVPWTFVPYTRAFGRAMYRTDERERYYSFVHQLSVSPTMTDFYAFCDLARRHALPRDTVVINGQTGDFISGGHVPTSLAGAFIDRRMWLDAILAKHHSLWTQLRTPEHDAEMRERVRRSFVEAIPERMEREEAMKRYEEWEWRARQCELVIPGQRVYDFFGLPWELPLWDDAYLAFWSRVLFDAKFRQSLYLEYLRTHDPSGVFQTPFRRYTPPWTVHLLSEALRPFGSTGDAFRRQYLMYWQKYAYFYAMYPYREYIRFARDHRNPSSCIAREVLERVHGQSLASLG